MAIKGDPRSRRERRAVALPDPITTPSPPPEKTEALAAAGTPINRGNSDQMPLSEPGRQQAAEVADQIQSKGGLDKLVVSPAVRTKETAQPIIEKQPDIPVREEPAIESWAQGNLEGEQETPQVQSEIRDLIRKNPRRVIPGQGSMSSKPGESFEQYRQRTLPAMRGIMQEFADGIEKNPNFKLGVPIHSSVVKLTKAWLSKGSPDDFAINPGEMDKHSEPPGTVARLFPNDKGEWEVNEVNLKNKEPLGPGIYLIRHAMTPQNTESYSGADAQQQALGKMTKHIDKLDFGRAQAEALKASKAGMGDDDIQKYIDAALPDAKTASQLSMPQVLAVIAAAGPGKKAEYAPLLKSHFGNISALAPDDQAEFAAHLQQISS